MLGYEGDWFGEGILIRRRRRVHPANQPDFRAAEFFLDQCAEITARTEALVMPTGGTHPECALPGLGLQLGQHLSQYLHCGAHPGGTGGLKGVAPNADDIDLLQQADGAFGQYQAHHPPIPLIGLTRDQPFTGQYQDALRNRALGQPQIFGRGLRGVAEPVGASEIQQYLQVDRLQAVRLPGLA